MIKNPVYEILELIREGISFDNIITRYYPDIDKKDIIACIDFSKSIIMM
ncbi:unnamed protein product [marine sediment metagenome]|uniref:Antitoxin n=1 Tax=marine sediment metagenome TaxID=412755 RepID=X1J360_9ZZZZ